MTVNINISENLLYKAMDLTEEKVCESWFDNDRDKYDDWAGDRGTEMLLFFIDCLRDVCNIDIDTYSN